MKTDRELLELAAKAAGYTSHGYGELVGGSPSLLLREADFTGMWAPLTDDGDALRLASKLEMMIDFMDCRVCAGHAHPEVVIDFDDGDHKRAIVLAAAAIGETM